MSEVFVCGEEPDDDSVYNVDKKWHDTMKNHKNDLSGKGIWDSGCRRTVAGSWWIENFRQEAAARGHEVTYEKDDAVFRFGNQGVLRSGKRWRLPVSLYGVSGSLLVNEVEGGCPLLISEVSTDDVGRIDSLRQEDHRRGGHRLEGSELGDARVWALGCLFATRGDLEALDRDREHLRDGLD